MIQYRKILELHFNAISQRTISTSVGSSRNTVSDVVKRAKNLGLERLTDTMTNQWLEELLFPEKQAIEKGYSPPDWEKVHKELQKKNITLKLLHTEYSQQTRDGKRSPMLIELLQRTMESMRRNIKRLCLFEESLEKC